MRTNARGTSAVTLDAAHHDRGPLSTATRRATVAPMPPERPSAATPARSIGARAAAQAAEQRGVVDRAALVTLGWSQAAIDRRIAEGLLRVLWPGVYAYGHSILTRDGWLMAATLACGEGAVLAQRASAAARGLLTAWSTIDVITPTKRGVGLDGIRAHRVRLRPEERDVHRGLPVTSLARTALDVAASEGAERVGELLDRALLEGQYDHTEMTALFRTRRGCRGMATLRIAVAALGDEGVIFRSWPERRARDLLRAAGIREFTVNAWFPTRAGHGYELDLWFPALRLNLETDGPHHRFPHQRRKDALRDADLRSFGVTVVRLPADLVTEHPEAFLAAARKALESRWALSA